jgi:RNA polymerase sigma-70 factor (ECF subfamily)
MGIVVSLELTGDRGRGFEAWVERYRPACERFFRRRHCRPDLASDLTQDTMVAILRNRSSFRGDNEATFRAWAGTIALTTWAKHWERERRRLDTEPLDDEPQGSAADPQASAAQEQTHESLQSAITRLPSEMQCIVLLICQGRTESEVAQLRGCSVNTVKAHLHQAREKLRRDLGGPDDGPRR